MLIMPDPISQCQQPSTPIAQQLLDGIRYLDVRLRVVGDELLSQCSFRDEV
jgi:1-phosphatidylinositol phosphodiesterase